MQCRFKLRGLDKTTIHRQWCSQKNIASEGASAAGASKDINELSCEDREIDELVTNWVWLSFLQLMGGSGETLLAKAV